MVECEDFKIELGNTHFVKTPAPSKKIHIKYTRIVTYQGGG